MHLITNEDFIDRFPEGKKIIFVGNAPSLEGEGLGQWIDSHNIVIRFNEAPLKGFENDVGSRTDILVSNPYPEGRAPIRLSGDGVVLIINPQTRRLPSGEFKEWVNQNPVLYTYTPDIVGVGNIDHLASLTTGVYGLHLLSRLLKPSNIAITGFTLFLNDTQYHYWNSSPPKGIHAHDLTVEASIFISIINAFRRNIEVTSDISWVANQVGKKLLKDTIVRPLSNKKWEIS